uniref:Uncharacterized protein n=1 Tax=Arundo donax TaxID=35708 RepID=A0A0A8ZC00_ARUDO
MTPSKVLSKIMAYELSMGIKASSTSGVKSLTLASNQACK